MHVYLYGRSTNPSSLELSWENPLTLWKAIVAKVPDAKLVSAVMELSQLAAALRVGESPTLALAEKYVFRFDQREKSFHRVPIPPGGNATGH
jgi:hypothetical protein